MQSRPDAVDKLRAMPAPVGDYDDRLSEATVRHLDRLRKNPGRWLDMLAFKTRPDAERAIAMLASNTEAADYEFTLRGVKDRQVKVVMSGRYRGVPKFPTRGE